VTTILRAKHAAGHEGIRFLWSVGDAVVALRDQHGSNDWRKTLARCGEGVGMHPSSLDDAARAARAFPLAAREPLLRRFEGSGKPLARSHVIVLARATPAQRATGIDALLFAPMSVSELRVALRRVLE
jgi:hypothetical protein